MTAVGQVSFATERASTDRALAALCDRELAGLPSEVAEAIRYCLMGEGKRLRPVLMLCAYEAAGGRGDASGLAAAVEVVHAYSLAHDDLPCMDDDDLRRGRPTLHKVFGVRVATVAGVAMVPLAATCAWLAARELGLSDRQAAVVVRELMGASGARGMIGGQLLDLEAEGHSLDLAELERVHRMKTGALIVASVRLGALAAGVDGDLLEAFDGYGRGVGLAFQIADDVLDVTATSDQLGKTAGRDALLHKSTYPALLGVEGARARAAELVEESCDALARKGLLTAQLEHLARFVITRQS
jgi:geranylgeranyl pyrophosphate synthase